MAKTTQIDDAGHARIEQVARHFRMTQSGAASLLVRAATDDRIRELATEVAGQFRTSPEAAEAAEGTPPEGRDGT